MSERKCIWVNGRDLLAGLFLLCLSIVFILVFSASTSPLYRYPPTADSEIFQTIGKFWGQGMLPYRDLFDHKGPLIFFLNMVGYLCTGNRTGVFGLQILFMTVMEIICYRMALALSGSRKKACLYVILMTAAMIRVFNKGNMTEEYILPLLAACLYGQVRYLQECGDHQAGWSFLYGVTFAFAVLTRITNALPMCCGVFCILIVLIRQKKWKQIGWNVIAFSGGGIFAGSSVCSLF